MMTWNYRVFQEEDGDYVVREVFYDEGGSIVACTADAVEPVGSTVEELGQCLDDFRAALAQPVLTLRDIPEAAPRSQNLVTGNAVPQAELRARLGLESIQDDKTRCREQANRPPRWVEGLPQLRFAWGCPTPPSGTASATCTSRRSRQLPAP